MRVENKTKPSCINTLIVSILLHLYLIPLHVNFTMTFVKMVYM